jgi:hypothetical protein
MTRSRDIADSTKTLDVDGGTIKLDGNYPVGTGSVALGDTALDSVQSAGTYNTAIGHNALTANTTATNNTSVGAFSLGSNTTGEANTAVGLAALDANTTGSNNVGLGRDALGSNTTASYNTAVGYRAGHDITTGDRNVTFGSFAGQDITTGRYNIAIGYSAGGANSVDLTGDENTAIGGFAGTNITSGSANVFLGDSTGRNTTTGGRNTGLGWAALHDNTTGQYNVAVGYQAGESITSGTQNTFVGYQAGLNSNVNYCSFFGEGAGYSTTGAYNTYIGHRSGVSMTSGANNTILGRFSGNQDGLDIRTSTGNIVLSAGDGAPRLIVNGTGEFGIGTNPAASKVTIYSNAMQTPLTLGRNTDGGLRNALIFYTQSSGGTVGTISINNSSTSYNTSSDYRLKENVDYTWDATTRLKQLKPARFNFISDADTTVDGFLAHEAQSVVPECVTGAKDAVDADGNPEYQGIDQSKLVPLLVKTIQELEARITALEA